MSITNILTSQTRLTRCYNQQNEQNVRIGTTDSLDIIPCVSLNNAIIYLDRIKDDKLNHSI